MDYPQTIKKLLERYDFLILDLKIITKSNINSIQSFNVGKNKITAKIKINATPEHGKANQALIKFLAKSFKIPQKNFTFKSGDRSSRKMILIQNDL